MTSVLRYGTDSAVELDLPPGVLLAECDAPRGATLRDTAAAVTAALDGPLDFPPLAQAVVHGDRVVLALEEGLPQAPTLVAAVVEYLVRQGIEPGQVTVLYHGSREQSSNGSNGSSEVIEPLASGPSWVAHRPGDRQQLAYLAAGRDGEPVYLNRALCEADFVLPIGCQRLPDNGGSVQEVLFPAFSDAKTQQRYRSVDAEQAVGRPDKSEVNWLLGVQFVLQVVPGPGDAILHVLAGEPEAVNQRGRELCEQAWNFSLPRRASLVIAAVEGDSSQQTWDSFGRALSAALEAVSDEGSVAICCDLETGPAEALQRLAQSENRHGTLKRLRKQRLPGLETATRLVEAWDRTRIFLLSKLDESVVEDLGMAPVSGPEEVARLARRHDSCILLSNAQHARVTVGTRGE